MRSRSRTDRILGGVELKGVRRSRLIWLPVRSHFPVSSEKSRVSAPTAPRMPKPWRSDPARTSPAFGVRLRDAFGAERRRSDRDRIQELKRRVPPCLINAAVLSTYPLGKSVRTTQATATVPPSSPISLNWSLLHFISLPRSALPWACGAASGGTSRSSSVPCLLQTAELQRVLPMSRGAS